MSAELDALVEEQQRLQELLAQKVRTVLLLLLHLLVKAAQYFLQVPSAQLLIMAKAAATSACQQLADVWQSGCRHVAY
jgi:hypothetical protein